MTEALLSELTDRDAVLAAIDEYDRVGPQEFLRKYGFGRARTYYLRHNGRDYDSKAIVAVAYGRQYPDRVPLTASDFSGGYARIVPVLSRLGFTVLTGSIQSAWALCANPGRYRIDDAVAAMELDWWTTRGRAISRGDRVAVWRTQGGRGQRGIVAFGEVVDGPIVCQDLANPFWVDASEGAALEERVQVRYVDTPGLPLWLDGPHEQFLASLAVARARGGTVFRFEDDQWAELVRLAGGWPDDEILDAIDASLDAADGAGHRQGYRIDPADRRAVELRAMALTEEMFAADGWEILDVSNRCSYDLHCRRKSEEKRVEVKGTTGDGAAVLLTPNEVAHAHAQRPRVALVVVSGIKLTRTERGPVASGGDVFVVDPWDPSKESLRPTGYVHNVERP